MYRKVHIFLRAFLTDICRIPHRDDVEDWTKQETVDQGWWFSRVEFTETRGIQHWHILAKLPGVLDTAVLGRMIHNGRLVRQEIKMGNIKPGMEEKAWEITEMGLLASRYVTLLTDSISQASFYTEEMDVDRHDPSKVINLEHLRKEYVNNYVSRNITVATHPLMRTFNYGECDPNPLVEHAKVASVSCLHNCIKNVCGGEEGMSGSTCRFSFPKKTMRHTVPAIMQINADQMEAQMLLRRTADRVPNLNQYLLTYWRGNHDVTVLIDAAHKLRYATKYVSKSKAHSELIDEVVSYLTKRSQEALPPNIKETLVSLVLADSSQRSFMSKQELAYRVMQLPEVRKSHDDVGIVGFYRRSNIVQSMADEKEIVYSDRTDYSAYAERCSPKTVCNGFDRSELDAMCLREFAETIAHRWIMRKDVASEPIPSTRRRFKNRDVDSGHWMMRKLKKRRHIRWSTVLYTERPHLYEEVELGNTTSQTLYFDLPKAKRDQLYRAYQELVCYVPWKVSPDESFLPVGVRLQLADGASDPEKDSRLELIFKIIINNKCRAINCTD